MSSEPCRHERAPQSDVDASGVLGDAGSRFEPGEADPAWRLWARDEIRRLRAVVDERQRTADWAWRCASGYAERAEKAEAERDALAEKVRRVEALTYGSVPEHNEGCEGEPDCPACWFEDVCAALAESKAAS